MEMMYPPAAPVSAADLFAVHLTRFSKGRITIFGRVGMIREHFLSILQILTCVLSESFKILLKIKFFT